MSEQERRAVGSVGEEASRLVDAAASLLGGTSRYAARPPSEDATGPVGEETGSHAGERHRCTGCPLCRGRTFVDSLGAETFDQLADLAGAVADSLRAAAEDRRGADGTDEEGTQP